MLEVFVLLPAFPPQFAMMSMKDYKVKIIEFMLKYSTALC